MSKLWTYLFSVLAVSLTFASLGVSARAVAQIVHRPYCYQCEEWPEDNNYYKCDSQGNIFGYVTCELSRGGKTCTTSNTPDGGPDCYSGLWPVFVLDGRISPDVESAPRPVAVGGPVLVRRAQQAVPTADVPVEVARHACTGAIMQRRYASARIAEMRSGLRRVSI